MNQLLLLAFIGSLSTCQELSSEYERELQEWRSDREQRLRAENGWLSLVGRYLLKDGDNSFGTSPDNDVVFPKSLEGIGPSRLGTVHVDSTAARVKLTIPDGVEFFAGEQTFSGSRELGFEQPDWVGIDRFRFHVISREGKFYLRLADNESKLRTGFSNCLWYPVDPRCIVEAKYFGYQTGTKIDVTNILGETTALQSAGYAEFEWNGESVRLDAVGENAGLFFVFRDVTAGDTTYPPGRFLTIDQRPRHGETFRLDFNRAYNPPCAFSEFTTCPIAPPQNVLKFRVEAGEKYRKSTRP